ncbi:hypothetical protein K466DRAFT_373621 [Polyporus arcularius HHB13444]|uniref:Uncharacterized protein n=1 Tax=Polyporus arcularius HHB13444 TaxID=1314778 RepID=A0A5C3P464_9APHY|nr:hypothetical protein K466DRAFT_373621 [Polyporus arcularius HHB13444]
MSRHQARRRQTLRPRTRPLRPPRHNFGSKTRACNRRRDRLGFIAGYTRGYSRLSTPATSSKDPKWLVRYLAPCNSWHRSKSFAVPGGRSQDSTTQLRFWISRSGEVSVPVSQHCLYYSSTRLYRDNEKYVYGEHPSHLREKLLQDIWSTSHLHFGPCAPLSPTTLLALDAVAQDACRCRFLHAGLRGGRHSSEHHDHQRR